MPGVGQERERAGQEAANDLDHQERGRENEDDRQGPPAGASAVGMPGVGVLLVRMAVLVGHGPTRLAASL